ncbi:hypothetical protein OH818_27400 [Jiella pelagia]|uniref:Uncharacterized protein n=1 Tax=Jiella pelagia TaxID=2986949 RepID=A0ABY7C0M1_9HYPH|nr:hypothetical protein OH818_27400 [Jiella pelagia]
MSSSVPASGTIRPCIVSASGTTSVMTSRGRMMEMLCGAIGAKSVSSWPKSTTLSTVSDAVASTRSMKWSSMSVRSIFLRRAKKNGLVRMSLTMTRPRCVLSTLMSNGASSPNCASNITPTRSLQMPRSVDRSSRLATAVLIPGWSSSSCLHSFPPDTASQPPDRG